MIHVLVVDDHAVVRAGICRLLDAERDIEVIGQTGLGREAVRLCQELQPNVVVLDYNLPDIDGLEATQQIVELGVKTRVLILTMYGNEEYATRLIRAGASGFVVKVAPAAELVQAVRKVAVKHHRSSAASSTIDGLNSHDLRWLAALRRIGIRSSMSTGFNR